MEYVDIFDEEGNFLGQSRDKNEVHKYGLWHKEVHVWIINDNNEFLMQRRSPNKKFNPNKWAVCAGHVKSGEATLEAALREVEEEIRIKLNKEGLKFLFSYKDENVENDGILINNCISDVYIAKINKDIDQFEIKEDEVSEIRYISCEEVRVNTLNETKDFSFRDEEYMNKLFSFL